MSKKRKKSAKELRNEVLKKRYQVYRRLGYNSYTARALSQRALDVSSLEISQRTGKIKRNHTTNVFIHKTMKEWENRKAIDNYTTRIRTLPNKKIVSYKEIPNDTVYTTHGMLTRDKRYRGETGKIVSIIKNENKITTDQAYYFFYYMNKYNLTYKEAKKQLLTNKEFEMYAKRR